MAVSATGDLVTDITAEQLNAAPTDETVVVHCDGHETNGIFPADHQQPAFTLLAVLDAESRLLLTIVDDSAQLMLGIAAGAVVTVRW